MEDVLALYALLGGFGFGAVVAGGLVFLLLRNYIPSYLAEKGKNLATREDVAAITREVERIRAEYTAIAEELRARHQLRLAALDKRLQTHQEAFTLWRELFGATHTDDVGKVVIKCQSWWEQNCLYLEPKVREAFVDAYAAAHTHNSMVRARADAKDIKESWSRITRLPNLIFESIQLPALSDLEMKALKPEPRTKEQTGG
jgi:hypothetical protein